MGWRDFTFPDKENEIDERIARYKEMSSHASTPKTGCFDASGASAPREDFNYDELVEQANSMGALE